MHIQSHTNTELKMDFGGNVIMAKTAKGTKYVRIGGYTRSNGDKVKSHCRSTPKTSKGKKK